MIQINKTFSYMGIIGLIPLVSCVSNEKNSESEADSPNVIYVFPDQMRNSAMGFWSSDKYSSYITYQGDPVITPNLDKFADQSVVFSSAYSNTPISSPHRGSLLTGMYPNKSGVPLNVTQQGRLTL